MTNNQTARSRWLAAAAVISLAGFAAGNVAAAEVASTDAADTATPAPQSGMKAYKDSRTGKLRAPTTEEKEADAKLASAHAQKVAKPVPIKTFANGTKRATDVDGVLQEEVVVNRNADGSLSYGFVSGGNADVSQAPAPSSAAEEK